MKLPKNLVPLFCVIMSALPIAQITSNATQINPKPVYGTVLSADLNQIKINSQSSNTYQGEMVLSISDKGTYILDATTGYPITTKELSEGAIVYAYIGNAMTNSFPPITSASLILGNIPQDYKVPSFAQIQSTTYSDSKHVTILTTTGGEQFNIPASCTIIPYLTKNFVTVTDLAKDRTCLIWSDYSNQATKIVLFPKENQTSQTGWLQQQGQWYYWYSEGNKHTGWLRTENKWYYMDPSSGVMQTGFITLDGTTYYLQDDGSMLTMPKTFTPDENGALH